ncbi:MAG TPA: zf-HC2 domain-containing protein [Candidatus Acidoferrales bacterium]|nr:zf-HC2 domain-containing protein [Candidatus Acidoferrales bacterium]
MDGEPCKEFEAKLESYLEGAEGSAEEVRAHLARCNACRRGLEDARLARELLREGLEPAREPSDAFATRVLAGIREQEAMRQQFWRPLEALASRLAVVAAMALLVLSVFLFEMGPSRLGARGISRTEVSEGFPELGGQAPSDEILQPLVGER